MSLSVSGAVSTSDQAGSDKVALEQEGALEEAPLDPGYYSRMFVVTKAMGGVGWER